MRSFYILLAAVTIAGLALSIGKLTKHEHDPYIKLIVASMLVVIFVFLFRFLSRMKD